MFSLKEKLNEARSKNVALGHFNISELAALHAIVRAARELDVPIVIGTSTGEANFIGMRQAVALIKSMREELQYPIFLNADHMRKLDDAKAAAKAGYDMVIFDAAGLKFEENVAETKRVVKELKAINPSVLVEGEIGYIGTSSKLLDKIPEGATIREEDMTTVEQAKTFVRETGVDLLAPAVGNIHGMMKNAKNPNLNIKRIGELSSAVDVPLVLHGGSGVSDEDFTSAANAGINMIHINTEIRIAWRKGIEESLAEHESEIAPYRLLLESENKVYDVVLNRLKLFNRL